MYLTTARLKFIRRTVALPLTASYYEVKRRTARWEVWIKRPDGSTYIQRWGRMSYALAYGEGASSSGCETRVYRRRHGYVEQQTAFEPFEFSDPEPYWHGWKQSFGVLFRGKKVAPSYFTHH